MPRSLHIRPFLALALLLLATAPGAAVAAQSPNPLEGLRFYVDQDSPAWLQWQAYQRAGQDANADLIWKIAREPRALWLGKFTRPNFAVKVRRLIDPVRERGEVPIFTVLRAEATQCNAGYTGGGPAEDARTREWYDDLARVIGDDRVVIAFEPDSLGTIDCQAPSRRDDRLRLLAYGVSALSKLPNATVYLEAGASDWEPAARTAKQLRAIGISKVRGFMLNVTHYDWTAANIQHGLDISRRVGGKPFIINTAENGRGPVFYRKGFRRINVWCNPGLRGLGPPPTTDTSHPKVDAYLWINRPGYAQSCQGRPIAWYPPRALAYARLATDWEKPPPGSRLGHMKRYPPSAFGIPR
ncbi:MAG: glycoside hydrolase family 6 protein [Actinomycetota bacterium]|nr:glycoside hydrolase family 6 protein [Actinomycetota bacterium]